MSFEAMTWAKDQKCGSAPAKLVLMMLANHSNGHTGQCNPRQKLLAKECEMCVNTLRGHINTLAELGLLEIQTRFAEGVQLSNQYVLNLGGVPQKLRGGTSEVAGGAHRNWYPVEQGKETGIEINPLPPTHGGKTFDCSAGEQVEVAREQQVENKPQTPVRGKRASKEMRKPTIEEFKVWLEKEHPTHVETGLTFYRTMESQDWINGLNKPILNVKSTFNSLVLNERKGWLDKYKQKDSGSLQLRTHETQTLPSFNPFLEAIK